MSQDYPPDAAPAAVVHGSFIVDDVDLSGRPFRRRCPAVSRRTVVAVAALCAAALFFVGLTVGVVVRLVARAHGFPEIDGAAVLRRTSDLLASAGGAPPVSDEALGAQAEFILEALDSQTSFVSAAHRVEFNSTRVVGTPELSLGGGQGAPLVYGRDFGVVGGSRGARLNAATLWSAAGCAEADWERLPQGSLVLSALGSVCTLHRIAELAARGKAVGVVVYDDAGEGLPVTASVDTEFPVFTATRRAAGRIAASGAVSLSLQTTTQLHSQANVLASTRYGSTDSVIVVGAHLGMGANDNACGAASVLELAVRMQRTGLHRKLRNRVVFAWWAGDREEFAGASAFLRGMDEAERSRVAAYIDVDTIGSPNWVHFVSDSSAAPEPLRAGCSVIEDALSKYFAARSLPTYPFVMDKDSDYSPFLQHGVPSGGLYAGSIERKTHTQQQETGGEQGEPYDPCFHKSCDTIRNVGVKGLAQKVNALAEAIENLGRKDNLASILGRKPIKD
eukprot:m51a1_g6622 hypothetical protein (505) ;mRNA; f:46928-48598